MAADPAPRHKTSRLEETQDSDVAVERLAFKQCGTGSTVSVQCAFTRSKENSRLPLNSHMTGGPAGLVCGSGGGTLSFSPVHLV